MNAGPGEARWDGAVVVSSRRWISPGSSSEGTAPDPPEEAEAVPLPPDLGLPEGWSVRAYDMPAPDGDRPVRHVSGWRDDGWFLDDVAATGHATTAVTDLVAAAASRMAGVDDTTLTWPEIRLLCAELGLPEPSLGDAPPADDDAPLAAVREGLVARGVLRAEGDAWAVHPPVAERLASLLTAPTSVLVTVAGDRPGWVLAAGGAERAVWLDGDPTLAARLESGTFADLKAALWSTLPGADAAAATGPVVRLSPERFRAWAAGTAGTAGTAEPDPPPPCRAVVSVRGLRARDGLVSSSDLVWAVSGEAGGAPAGWLVQLDKDVLTLEPAGGAGLADRWDEVFEGLA